MIKKVLGLCIVIGLIAMPALASDKGAGCGLGKVVFEGNSGFLSHTVASTTNGLGSGTSGLNTQNLGMTFGTLGCDANSVIKADFEQATFVTANLENISQDMAVGNGQYLESLAGLMGCPSADYAAFGEFTQKNYPQLVSDPNVSADELLSGLKAELAGDPRLSASCRSIS